MRPYIRELLLNCPILSLFPWGNEASERMARFYFNLAGKQNVDDPGGLAFEDELQAFRAAERLAKDLASAHLCCGVQPAWSLHAGTEVRPIT